MTRHNWYSPDDQISRPTGHTLMTCTMAVGFQGINDFSLVVLHKTGLLY